MYVNQNKDRDLDKNRALCFVGVVSTEFSATEHPISSHVLLGLRLSTPVYGSGWGDPSSFSAISVRMFTSRVTPLSIGDSRAEPIDLLSGAIIVSEPVAMLASYSGLGMYGETDEVGRSEI